jgi:hypothetical protein
MEKRIFSGTTLLNGKTNKIMKLGLILECPLKGTDQQVYEYIIKQLNVNLQVVVQPAGNNKPQMIQNCGKTAKLLFNEGCNYIAIIWDLMPPWGGKPCRKQDVEQICTKLEESQIDLDRIKLICIEPELESIFLVDGKALTAYKKQCCRPHPVEIFKGKKLAKNDNSAKTCISNYLGRKYNDISEAIKIVEHVENYDKISKKHLSFKRFREFVESLK